MLNKFEEKLKLSRTSSQRHRFFDPKTVVSILTAGLITGTLLVTSALSVAAVIFSGPLAPYLSLGIRLVLVSAVICVLVIALKTSVPGTLANPQAGTAAMLAFLASSMAVQLSSQSTRAELLPTTLAGLALTTCLTGLLCLTFGWFKLGHLTRYIPYPVMGGCLAGTGWLLVQGGFSFLTQTPVSWSYLPALFQGTALTQWIPGLGIALLLLVVIRRYVHPLIFPGMMLFAIAGFYIVLLGLGLSLAEAKTQGLLLGPFAQGQPLSTNLFGQVNWAILAGQSLQIIIISAITVFSFLIKLTGIELTIRRELEINRELQATGLANILSGLGGGVIGFHDLSLTTLNYNKIGVHSRKVGMVAALVCGTALFLGPSMFTYFPRAVLGGSIIFMGLNFLVEWLYDARPKLTRSDYSIIVLIFAAVVIFGFFEGVAIGLAITILHFVVTYSRMQVMRYNLSGRDYVSKVERPSHQAEMLKSEGDYIEILILQGFIFFGTAHRLLTQVRQRLEDGQRPPIQFLLLDFRLVHGLDSSATLTLNKLKDIAQAQSFRIVFTHCSARIQNQLYRASLVHDNEPNGMLLPDLDRGIEWCEEQLLKTIPWRRRRSLPLSLQLEKQFSNNNHVDGFLDYLEERDYSPGDILFQQGDAATILYILESGQVTLYLADEFEQAKRLQTIESGHPIGELSFFRQHQHVTTARVDQSSTLHLLSVEAWLAMQQDHPDVANTFQALMIQRLSDRLVDAYQEISALLQ